jgi:hypothetical protein
VSSTLQSAAAISSTVTVLTAVQVLPLGGTFSLGLGNSTNKTPLFTIDATAEELRSALATLLNINKPSLSVSRLSSTPSNRTWEVTFPVSAGNIQMLAVDNSMLVGTGVSALVTQTRPGSDLLSGTYVLNTAGKSINLGVTFTVDTIQETIRSALSTSLNGKTVLVDQLVNSVYRKKYRLTFPISLGNLADVSLPIARTGPAS